MKENLQIAIDFANKLKNSSGILQIILFGSVAKGEDKTDSDIDIAIIHNLKDIEKLKSFVNKFVHEKIQVVYVDVNKLSKEIEIVSALAGEGLLLYGKPINVSLKGKALKPFILLVYDTTDIDKKKRMLLNRALYGSISRSSYKGKKYTSESKGVLAEPGITKLARACLLLEPRKALKIRGVLRRFGVKVREELIWR